MKFLSVLLFALTTQAFAGVCDYSYTSEFKDDVKAGKIKLIETKEDLGAFTKQEKFLIYTAVTHIDNSVRSEREALWAFLDISEEGQGPGGNRGTIEYYKVGKETVILVHHYPGDTEVGAFFTLKEKKVKMTAVIADSEIDCQI